MLLHDNVSHESCDIVSNHSSMCNKTIHVRDQQRNKKITTFLTYAMNGLCQSRHAMPHLCGSFCAAHRLDDQQPGCTDDQEADGEPVHDPQHLEGPVVRSGYERTASQSFPCPQRCKHHMKMKASKHDHSFVHSCIHAFIHSFIHSFTHSLIHSLRALSEGQLQTVLSVHPGGSFCFGSR